MSTLNRPIVGAYLLATLILSGCGKTDSVTTLPEVNAANCEPEKTALIRDKYARNKFIDLCARMSTYKPSRPRGW
jgi:entry exclusion lipoprotein TrbK